ncbi:cold shock and DUF1294 domain-containing protein [Cupriavidus consociatus]|uniref:cold shock and DUF1294 domain-containing protein n=1 Tax=Cupriavidus consociatus TaxID=2821357 RepID=UPI001AE1B1A5|nr:MULTISPECIES: cold shock and DUF1294 domain-containing protein [unclassified Cupriavidus]MBP0624744.1 DUF1294 domain-containing protein [Cupriavidus sp. LEh25]MDK2661460.1 DUF1294 domain-containing protein [Cupriavidus sp. LEh21]
MKKAGRVKTWHADKGFGFIDVHADTKDVFFHITALQTRAVTPTPGDRVSFELGKGRDGRIQALNVAIVGAPKARSDPSPWPVFAGLAALGLIVGGALIGYFPRQAGIVSLLASLITFFAYADDKTRASRNTWRTPETTLHLLALCGGWPGALAAQHLLRHKNRKRAFQVTFWGTVAVNVGAMVLWHSVMAA